VNAIIQFARHMECPASIKPKMYFGPILGAGGSLKARRLINLICNQCFPKASTAVNNFNKVKIHTYHVLPCRSAPEISYRVSRILDLVLVYTESLPLSRPPCPSIQTYICTNKL
jgi:hypothetical protein